METRKTLAQRTASYRRKLCERLTENKMSFGGAMRISAIDSVAYERGLIEGYHLGMKDAKEILHQQKGNHDNRNRDHTA